MVSRREFLAGAGLGGLSVTWAGLNHATPEYDSRLNAEYPFSEPILDVEFSAVEVRYPRYYQRVIETREELERLFRREYVRSELPTVVDTFDSFDMAEGFVTVFGVVMPATRKLHPTGDHVEVDWLAGPKLRSPRTLHLGYEVVERNSASDDERFNTVVDYWETNGSRPPDRLRVEIRHGGTVASDDSE